MYKIYSIKVAFKELKTGQRGSLVITAPSAQAWQPTFSPWIPREGKQRELILRSCLLISVPAQPFPITTKTILIIKLKSVKTIKIKII